MAERWTITLAVAIFALLSITSHPHQAQGAREATAAGGLAGAAEFVLLETTLPPALAPVNSTTGSDIFCMNCKCCLKNTPPQPCLTTCCFRRSCSGSVCSAPRAVSCGCNGCVYPPPPPPRTK
ncbi:hypothetical protein U9M48_015527 [Paspalum notatum var. saurae]|uniref:Uncharacterized protein n=1 Tax=Paspalum notatum var. saurae TaxID=547442 RepID=A0AAQ3T3T9_PASNO